MCHKTTQNYLNQLGQPARIWAIPSIHGEIGKLTAIHDAIYEQISVRDKVVYLGNYSGYGPAGAACIDEILTFRRMVLAKPAMMPKDIVYLRGQQEEMWEKLLQLSFAPDPVNIFLWMLGQGLSPTLSSYGLCPHDGIEACRYGGISLHKWISHVRQTLKDHPGHDIFYTQLKRAAHSETSGAYPMLFVNAGVNTEKPLEAQNDAFWWQTDQFETMQTPYLPFQKVVRGYDPAHKGMMLNCITATLDDGCGFGGKLIAATFESDGHISNILEA